MTHRIGVTINYNAVGGTLENRAADIEDMVLIGGDTALAQDDVAMAHTLRARMDGGAVVMTRRYRPDDKELWRHTSAQEWLDSVRDDGGEGIVIQYGNEPVLHAGNLYDATTSMAAVLRGAHARGLHVGVVGTATGNPEPELIESGGFDRVIDELDEDDELVVHEYFAIDPLSARDKDYQIGRVRAFLVRMKARGCRCRKIRVAEYGRDLGGGKGDGWRGQGWSAEYYAALLIKGLRDIYLPLAREFGVWIAVNIFCAGHGYADDWQSFNVEGVRVIRDACAAWNKEHPLMGTIPDYSKHDWGDQIVGAQVRVDQTINIRAQPDESSEKAGQLRDGDIVTYWRNPFQGTNYLWYKLLIGGIERYAAKVSNLRFTFVAPEPTPQTVTLTAEQWAAVVNVVNAAAALESAAQKAREVIEEVGIPPSAGF